MNVKSALTAMLFLLVISACTQEDTTYEEIQTNVKIESNKSTAGGNPSKDGPEKP